MLFDEATVTTTEQAVEAAAQKALPSHRLRHGALLVLHTMIWGSTFLVVKNAIAISGPLPTWPAARQWSAYLSADLSQAPGEYYSRRAPAAAILSSLGDYFLDSKRDGWKP